MKLQVGPRVLGMRRGNGKFPFWLSNLPGWRGGRLIGWRRGGVLGFRNWCKDSVGSSEVVVKYCETRILIIY